MTSIAEHPDPLIIVDSPQQETELVARYIKTMGCSRGKLAILEAGCGNSWYLELPGVQYSLTGVDLNQDALNIRKFERADLDRIIRGDLRTVALDEAEYDVIYNSFVLEHVEKAEQVLSNFFRWLKPGGILILRIPNPMSVYGFLARWTPFWFHVLYKRYVAGIKTAGRPGYDPFPIVYDRIVSRSGIRRWCAEHGMEIREEVGWTYCIAKPGLTSVVVRGAIGALHLLSFGRLAADHVNLTYVIEKPAPKRGLPKRSLGCVGSVAMIQSEHNKLAVDWPVKYNLFGVHVSAVTCEEACDAILNAARQCTPAVVSAFDAHALIEAAGAPQLTQKANQFGMIVPDGQPVRWAINWLYGAGLECNVRGSELMWQLSRRAAAEGVPIYLYGSTTQTLAALERNLRQSFTDIEIAGMESPPFRQLSSAEDAEMVARVNSSGAGIMFIGLGAPKQDHFAADHGDKIQVVQICVGAAFDFHAGFKATAPEWMQRHGLEWLFRLCQEPTRLWKRYLITNTTFIAKLVRQFARQRVLGFVALMRLRRDRRIARRAELAPKAANCETS